MTAFKQLLKKWVISLLETLLIVSYQSSQYSQGCFVSRTREILPQREMLLPSGSSQTLTTQN